MLATPCLPMVFFWAVLRIIAMLAIIIYGIIDGMRDAADSVSGSLIQDVTSAFDLKRNRPRWLMSTAVNRFYWSFVPLRLVLVIGALCFIVPVYASTQTQYGDALNQIAEQGLSSLGLSIKICR